MIRHYDNFYVEYKEIKVDWSEDAVEYRVYNTSDDRLLHTDMCEEHELDKYVKEDYKKYN